MGYNTLTDNLSGNSNTAVGTSALQANSSGFRNVAIGGSSMFLNATGSDNTALGANTLSVNTTGSNNLAIGRNAGRFATGDDNVFVANEGNAADTNTVRIGTAGTHSRTFISGISGVPTGLPGATVLVDANGQLGTISSSERYKEDISDMLESTNGLMDLRPVTFHYKHALEDGSKPIQYGLIAEEVAKVYPELVQFSKQGQAETVLYHLLSSMLLNELQKQHRLNEAQADEIEQLRKRLDALEAAGR